MLTSSRVAAAILYLFAMALAVAGPVGPAQAASGPDVTVQIEGETATIVEKRPVSLDYNRYSPPAPWPGTSAPANSIGAAIETALNDTYGPPPAADCDPPRAGWWDRASFISEIKCEAQIWPRSWTLWTNRTYGNKGAMDGGDQWGLNYGDDLLVSAGGSIGNWPDCPCRPERLPVDLSGAGIEGPAAVPVDTPFSLEVTSWMPQEGDTDSAPGPSERQRASHPIPGEDFTVVAMPDGATYDRDTVGSTALGSGRSDGDGRATLSIDRPGPALVKAVREDSGAPFGSSPLGAQGRSAAHPVCVYEPNSGQCGTPVFTPAASLDVGRAEVGGIGGIEPLTVSAPTAANTVTGVRVLGPDAADFVVSAGNCVDEAVGAGSECEIRVRLAPTAAGQRSATLRVKSSTESIAREIALTGTGTQAAQPSTDPPRLTLRATSSQARIRRGKAVRMTTRVANTGRGRAANVLICLRTPAGFVSGRACAKRPAIAPGRAVKVSFRVRATRRAAPGRFRKAAFRATADGVGFTNARVRVAARR